MPNWNFIELTWLIKKECLIRMGAENSSEKEREYEHGTLTKKETAIKRPSLYRVVLLNDDFTPMDFVIQILQNIFNKSYEDAQKIMLHVHNHGIGVCGIYTYEVAETKVSLVLDSAKRHEHPLQCSMEKVE